MKSYYEQINAQTPSKYFIIMRLMEMQREGMRLPKWAKAFCRSHSWHVLRDCFNEINDLREDTNRMHRKLLSLMQVLEGKKQDFSKAKEPKAWIKEGAAK